MDEHRAARTTTASPHDQEAAGRGGYPEPSAARRAHGKQLRKQVPRAAHAEYLPSDTRRCPIELLREQDRSRWPQLLPIRYERMLASPLTFLRGAARVMAADLARTPTTGILVQLCGDMHLLNFGAFASAERRLVFGINDFDETLPGPWEWDLKRLAASVAVCARFLGCDAAGSEEAVQTTARAYRCWMDAYADLRFLDLWYCQLDEQDVLDSLSGGARDLAVRVLAKARKRTNLQVLETMTELVDDEHRIRELPPLVVREARALGDMPIGDALQAFLFDYGTSLTDDRRALLARYHLVDVARKVVGVGSVGRHCWVIYLEGNGADDPLFLQVKQAEPAVGEPWLGRSLYGNAGQRVVAGQRAIQGAPDIFLGWGEVQGTPFYVRQLRDMKGSARFDPRTSRRRPFLAYCGLCGRALALAHAKSGDAAAIAGYLGRGNAMDAALAVFAASYADQTERDHAALAQAAEQGAVPVANTREVAAIIAPNHRPARRAW